MLMEITPPHMQKVLAELPSVGMPPIITMGAVGIQGETVAGMQGIGVNTPSAAVVAAATVGLAIELQTPNGTMFTNGLKSMMFAAGLFSAETMLVGSTLRVEGAAPKVH